MPIYNSLIDIVGLLFPLIWPTFKCVCLTHIVELPWKPVSLHYVWCRLLVSVFIAMKMKMMPWSFYSTNVDAYPILELNTLSNLL